jgi:hypothetical protein
VNVRAYPTTNWVEDDALSTPSYQIHPNPLNGIDLHLVEVRVRAVVRSDIRVIAPTVAGMVGVPIASYVKQTP